MNIPKLLIQSTDAKVGLSIQQPKQHIQQPPAELQIKQPSAEISISVEKGQLFIDASQARSEYGFKTIQELEKMAAKKGYQDLLDGIARRAREGGQLMSIGKNNNALQSIAKSKTSPNSKSLGIVFIPSAKVKLDYKPAEVDINVQTKEPIINAKINKPIHNYTPGKVNVDLIQYPSLKIDWLV
ncbi:DUF6470 family protein [Ureibacillus sp. GCM10028918]|uniref:DUF6470 family protein n=1 Tax=Ureibacillus sp. GCM10028918 TaxID=3273429 RepID=UPI00361F1962